MSRIARKASRLLPLFLLLAVLLLLVGCATDTGQNTFDPAGDVAAEQRDLFNLVLWPAVVILIIVEGLLFIAVMRFRQKKGEASLPKQVHGNTRLEVAWTVAPAILLLVLAVPTVASIWDLARDPKADALQVTAVGQQWSWEFQYPGLEDTDGNPLVTYGELHIPMGREIGVELESRDVIHSFWIPRLAGKLDAIPGRTGRMWFNAKEPGVFSGQCAEFCGLEHYKMRFCVVVHETSEEFAAWASTAKAGSGELQPKSCGG